MLISGVFDGSFITVWGIGNVEVGKRTGVGVLMMHTGVLSSLE